MSTKHKTAIVLGASGLIGSQLLDLLLNDDNYARVTVFVRKNLSLSHPKLTQHIIDFDKPETYAHLVNGDAVFCCLGTTIKQAKTREAFRRVDHDYPVQFAKIAALNDVPSYLLVSSVGADVRSSTFYLRTKGECEDAIKNAGLRSFTILRPGPLSGERAQFRLGEKLMLPFLKIFAFLLVGKMRNYRAILASTVARTMLFIAKKNTPGVSIIESSTIQKISYETKVA